MALEVFKKRFFSVGAKLPPEIKKINELEKNLGSLSDQELKDNSLKIKKRAIDGESLDNLLPIAFALVREASKRTLGQRHFDVQLWGGIVMHRKGIVEMLTGEGKTLAATAPVYLNALQGKGAHIITVNDYLAKRDMIWMGQIYYFLGLSIACIVHDNAFMYDPEWKITEDEKKKIDKERDEFGSYLIKEDFLRPISRREAYRADITYGTNHEFGFDYLRDNIRNDVNEQVQRELNFAVIDEVDSILIDESRTPLIISSPDSGSAEYYKVFAQAVRRLKPDEDYVVDEKLKSVEITENGIDKIEKITGIADLYSVESLRLVHYLESSLKARALYEKDREYVVRNGEIIIVDQFTGRMMFGRRYSAGLHQAIEAKEGVIVREESKTFAQITIQNYFRLYKKLAGMTGTAQTSAEEFHKVYGLEVISIPPNRPLVRKNLRDLIYKTVDAKYEAIIKDVKERHEKGQPILLGTVSIERNEFISGLLHKSGIPHQMLNAKNNEHEGKIIAQAGKLGCVTVATNMAGRGVDIILGGNPQVPKEAEKVKELGGLHVIGTERHEARRIDNQLRGRSGRQGDPGSSQFFLSLEDDLMRIFGGERLKKMVERFNFPDDIPIENKMISKAIEQAQTRVEGFHFDSRKNLLEYDDILNRQRLAFYSKRQSIVDATSIISKNSEIEEGKIEIKDPDKIKEILQRSIFAQLSRLEKANLKEEDLKKIFDYARIDSGKDVSLDIARKFADEKIGSYDQILLAGIGKQLLVVLNLLWMNHLEDVEAIMESVRLRAYGQRDPLVEYRKEGRTFYDKMEAHFDEWVFNNVLRVEKVVQDEDTRRRMVIGNDPKYKNVGRNDLCPCGSGKKFKRCHGA
jgi:preprotein translocase subunit SecA